jgi:spore coat polysaccharide biosynthesis protein SpsF (cytidylyltransferase family)
MGKKIDTNALRSTLKKAIEAARSYHNITGKPLGITVEVVIRWFGRWG